MYKVSRVVMGENKTFQGGDEYLRKRGIEVINVESAECEKLMKTFIKEHPEDWYVLFESDDPYTGDEVC